MKYETLNKTDNDPLRGFTIIQRVQAGLSQLYSFKKTFPEKDRTEQDWLDLQSVDHAIDCLKSVWLESETRLFETQILANMIRDIEARHPMIFSRDSAPENISEADLRNFGLDVLTLWAVIKSITRKRS